MNKTEFVSHMQETGEYTKKEAEKAYDVFTETVIHGLEKDAKVQLIGFGNFEIRDRAARTGRNPQTGEEIQIPAKKVPAFKPGKALKDYFQ